MANHTEAPDRHTALGDAYMDGRAAGMDRAVVTGDDGAKYVIIPRGMQMSRIAPLNPPEPVLERITESVRIHDRASFEHYVDEFKQENTRIFAEPGFLASSGRATFTAIIDYHERDQPMRYAHTAVYQPRYSDQWIAWTKLCQGEITQAQVAEAIEERRQDIVTPAAATLLDMIRTFKASRKVEFNSVTNQRDGTVVLGYSDTANGTDTSTPLPEQMELGIPVYFRGTAFKVPIWIRYRVGNGGVKFQFKIDRANVIEDEAFKGLMTEIKEATNVVPIMGSVK